MPPFVRKSVFIAFIVEGTNLPRPFAQVWVHAELDREGRVRFAADSDSELTRGLAAVLVASLSGLTPSEVLQVRSHMLMLSCQSVHTH